MTGGWLARLRAARDLGPGGFRVPWWREPVEGRARRLGAREYIALESSRPPALEDRDPLHTARIPGRRFWTVLGAWAVLAGVRAWRLWRRTGSGGGDQTVAPAPNRW